MSKRFAAILIAAVWAFASAPASRAADVQVTIGSSPPGFTAIILAGGVAVFVSREVEGVSMSVPTTKGFVHNLRAMEAGTFEFMINATGLVAQAVAGLKPFKKKFEHIRGLLPIVDVPYHFVTLPSSGVVTVADLKGKRVNVGPKGGVTNLITEILLSVAGISKDISRERLNARAAGTALTDNRIAAFLRPAPLPAGNIIEAGNVSGGVRILPISGEFAEGALKRMPGRSHMTIPAGLYKGVDKPVKVIGHSVFFAVRDTVPPDVVYKVVKGILSKKGEKFLKKVHKAMAKIYKLSPGFKSFTSANIKLHPGVERYWKEKGVEIPAHLAH
ncbi:MAG: TAXI family TRAP transporter solute-binding subunit [bacterium]